MAEHEIRWVTGFERVAPFTLRVTFKDGMDRVIDFQLVLSGAIFEPLRDPDFFDRVTLDTEFGTLSWPNGADFDPAVLYHWPSYGPEIAARALEWNARKAS